MPKPTIVDFSTIFNANIIQPLCDLAWDVFGSDAEDRPVNTADEAREKLKAVAQAGDTMTGPLTLPASDPTLNNHAARKSYVDDSAQAAKQYADDQIAAMLEAVYRVGALYFCAASDDPNLFLPGTWTLLTEGQFLVSAGGTGDYALGATGGEEEVTLSDAQVRHKHKTAMGFDNVQEYNLLSESDVPIYGSEVVSAAGYAKLNIDSVSANGRIAYTNSNQQLDGTAPAPHENRPPFLAVNMWQRTA